MLIREAVETGRIDLFQPARIRTVEESGGRSLCPRIFRIVEVNAHVLRGHSIIGIAVRADKKVCFLSYAAEV